jgi:hypothetical protein
MKEELNKMEIGDRIKFDVWDVWRMPTGWVMAIDAGAGLGITSVFVPDVLYVDNMTSPYKQLLK